MRECCNPSACKSVRACVQIAEFCSFNVMSHGRTSGAAVLSPTSYELNDIFGIQHVLALSNIIMSEEH